MSKNKSIPSMPNAQNTKANPNAQHIQRKKKQKRKSFKKKGQLLNQAIKSFSIDLGGKVVSKEKVENEIKVVTKTKAYIGRSLKRSIEHGE